MYVDMAIWLTPGIFQYLTCKGEHPGHLTWCSVGTAHFFLHSFSLCPPQNSTDTVFSFQRPSRYQSEVSPTFHSFMFPSHSQIEAHKSSWWTSGTFECPTVQCFCSQVVLLQLASASLLRSLLLSFQFELHGALNAPPHLLAPVASAEAHRTLTSTSLLCVLWSPGLFQAALKPVSLCYQAAAFWFAGLMPRNTANTRWACPKDITRGLKTTQWHSYKKGDLKMSIRKRKSMGLPLLRTQSSPEPLFCSSAAWTFSFSQDVLPHLSLSLLKEGPLYPPPTSAPAKRKWKNIKLSPTHGLSAGHIRDLPKDLFIQYYILLSFPIIYLIVRYLTQILMSEETHQNTVSVERERLHIN